MIKKTRQAILGTLLLLSVAVTWLSVVVEARAAVQYIGALSVINNTTLNSSFYPIGSFLVNPGTFSITNATTLSNTSALTVNLQWSMDGVNGFTVATWNPPSTNPGTFIWTPSVSAVTVYQRIQDITTNLETNGIIQN